MTPERFLKIKTVLGRRQPDLTVLADGVHKSHNISAMLRTCDAVGIHRVHAVSSGGNFRRHHMISGGSQRWVDVVVHTSSEKATSTLESQGWRLIAAHPEDSAKDYRDIDYTQKVAIIFGSELKGLAPNIIKKAGDVITIPTNGFVASLNVSVAAALILFEACRQRETQGLYNQSRLSCEEFNNTLFEWSYPQIAERCRMRGQPYPTLTQDGSLKTNPFASPEKNY
ncbi:MAG: tRNA (guanosine(18)-2'-O)-methyltransferase TrmH [Pseudomonadota bacterium]|nr:tRNA (guanosine(18)-2'-O)-methyltransferase TrmH [Pseudomonadota bacterium]